MLGLGHAPPRGSAELASDPDQAVGVWNCAAMMPGVPCGATHSTLTSSSGASTVSPSHSLTRCGSPAISRQAREKAPSAPALGWSSAGISHWMKNGSCGSAIRPLTPICFQRSSVPSGRCRLPATASRPSRASTGRDVVDRDDPAEPAAAERGAGAHGLAERRLVGRRVVEHLDDLEVGAVGQRQDHVAGAEARVHAAVDEVPAEQSPEALGGAGEAVRSGGVGEMVQAHAEHSEQRAPGTPSSGVGFS